MANARSWRESTDRETELRSSGREHLSRLMLGAVLLSLLLHIVAFFALDRIKIVLGMPTSQELNTGPVNIERVEISSPDPVELPPKEEAVVPPKDLAPLLDEIDVFDKLPKDKEIDMRPDIDQAVFDIKVQNPTQAGSPDGATEKSAKGFMVDAELPDFGKSQTSLPSAAEGQVILDPGSLKANEFDSTKLVDDLLKKGANGKVERGSLDGAIDDVLGLPANVLVGKTTTLPGDLLFEYNSAELRESARVGLMKLGLLIDSNPGLYCWIDGYSDQFGGDDYNYDLSQRRAESVRTFLTSSLGIDTKRVFARGFGRQEPKVKTGTIEQQAPNRRVEIKMRKTTPPPVERIATGGPDLPPPPPPKAKPAPETPAPVDPPKAKPAPQNPPKAVAVPDPAQPQKPVLEKPARALPVEETPPRPPRPPRAQTVPEDAPPRAVPRAQEIEE